MLNDCVHFGHGSDAGITAEQGLGDAGHLMVAPGSKLLQLLSGEGMLVHASVHGRAEEQWFLAIPGSDGAGHEIITDPLKISRIQ